LAEIRYQVAISKVWRDWDWESADMAFKRTLNLNPNYPLAHMYYSHFLYIMDRPNEAGDHAARAMEIDPFNSLLKGLYGMALNFAGRSDEAIEMLYDALNILPVHPIVRSTLRTSYELAGRYEEALEMWREFYRERNDSEGLETLERGYEEAGYHGAMLRAAEMMVERSKTTYVTPWQIATLYTRAVKKAEAIEWFEQAYEQHDGNMPYISADPLFDNLRDEPRFKDLLKKMGLPTD
jgi:tetratricopeptide (TPR) repeat protein